MNLSNTVRICSHACHRHLHLLRVHRKVVRVVGHVHVGKAIAVMGCCAALATAPLVISNAWPHLAGSFQQPEDTTHGPAEPRFGASYPIPFDLGSLAGPLLVGLPPSAGLFVPIEADAASTPSLAFAFAKTPQDTSPSPAANVDEPVAIWLFWIAAIMLWLWNEAIKTRLATSRD